MVLATKKRGFMDGYKTYDIKSEGYGDSSQWKDAFNERMGYNEAKIILSNDNPYSILGILANSTLSEIKKAFRHKNKNIDTTEKMQKIIAAYTFLTSKKQ